NSWTDVAPLNHARSGHSATSLWDGRILLAGGNDGAAAIDSLEIYDPNFVTFTLLDSVLSSPRAGHAATLLYDGRVLVAGGLGGPNTLASPGLCGPYADVVSAGPSLATARAGHPATTLLGGKVLIAAGSSDAQELASAEIFDPTSNTIAPA